jgi:catechol 2,3-dioxygenase-like lactoylglutathione lyase family enzyme
VEGGRYHYVMTIPEHGLMAWHGVYAGVDRPNRIDAEEWFVMGDRDPTGPPAVQSLTFDAVDGGLTEMTMKVEMPEPEDPDTFMEQAAAGLSSSLATMDKLVSTPTSEMSWTLEVVVVPVSDVDQSKAFYHERLGFHLDHDHDLGEGRRIVQLTPPGSGCSIAFGTGVVPQMRPGSVKGLQLVVSDVERADQILTERGVETSGVQVLGENPEPTAHPLDNVGMIFLADPDGNEWAIQQMSSRAVSDERDVEARSD